jgi:hypothetical protein
VHNSPLRAEEGVIIIITTNAAAAWEVEGGEKEKGERKPYLNCLRGMEKEGIAAADLPFPPRCILLSPPATIVSVGGRRVIFMRRRGTRVEDWPRRGQTLCGRRRRRTQSIIH